jgi:acylphosphatase
MSETPIRRRATVHGDVQGVFFRDSTRREAQAHGVGGWVRNRSDGSVEAVLEGPPHAVQEMLRFLADGPPRARVERVDVSEEEPEGLREFQVR